MYDFDVLDMKFGELVRILAISELTKFSKSEFKVIKTHKLVNHFLSIILFENPRTYSTQVEEY